MSTKTETKINIPIEAEGKVIQIVGILAHHQDLPTSPPSESRPLALICHGALAHKDQTYHKTLVKELDIDSFRFDFRANHESAGSWAFAGFNEDLQDIITVRAYLATHFNYHIQLLVGHSRGALDCFSYLGLYANDSSPPEQQIPYYVSLGCRYNMDRIRGLNKLYAESFAEKGFFERIVKVAGQEKKVIIHPHDIEAFATWDIEGYLANAPSQTDYLLVHGLLDEVVPAEDVAGVMNQLQTDARRVSKSRLGSVQLSLIPNADHNFRGHYPEVVSQICDWFRERRALDSPSSVLALPETIAKVAPTEGQLEETWRSSIDAHKLKL